MSHNAIRIATRNSPLAMWQAETVARAITSAHPGLAVEFVSMATTADQMLDVPISELGGKGAFSKEVQRLVLADEADLAVHSAKDLQAETPAGLVIAAVPERGDPRDALIGASIAQLVSRSEAGESPVVATGSNRRRVQLAHRIDGLGFEGLRGNIATRLSKASSFDAIVMAAAALERLELHLDDVEVLDPTVMVPQVGQGALAIECRDGDGELLAALALLEHAASRTAVDAERAFLVELGGDCDLPAGAFATVDGSMISLRAVLASEDESQLERVHIEGTDPIALGTEAAVRLRSALTPPA